MDDFKQRILNIQSKLNVPKNQRNNFGKYNYRSAEDILEALKPLLKENELIQMISDEIQLVGDRYYIKATVTVKDTKTDAEISVSAFAREEESKKGMDASQLTGSTSSYARKYALNGMWSIDDNKDADTESYQKQTQRPQRQAQQQVQAKPQASNNGKQVKAMFDLANDLDIKPKEIQKKMMSDFNKSATSDLTDKEIAEIVNWLSSSEGSVAPHVQEGS